MNPSAHAVWWKVSKSTLGWSGQEKVVLNLLEGVDHFDSEHNSPENMKQALDFLDKYMK